MRDLGFGGMFFLIFTLLGALPVEVKAGNELRDIRGPLDLSWMSPWVGRGLIVAIPLLILAAAWLRRRRKQALGTRELKESAVGRARKRLAEVLSCIGEPDPFCTRLSEIIRVYLEERFGLQAPDQTTEEFLEGLKISSALDLRHKQLLEVFLTQCDWVKFAKGNPEKDELGRLHQVAATLVDETGEGTRGGQLK
ncbi:MAG: DUF4381 family protein [Pedosphaera sp.]|nr:DUF4381 family protein [Pedosphaera sp.]